jgi:hypothetical protein
MLDVVAPVVNPALASAGSPRTSRTQRPAISSTTEAAGLEMYEKAFWSHALVNQSAASAAGSDPPTTNP